MKFYIIFSSFLSKKDKIKAKIFIFLNFFLYITEFISLGLLIPLLTFFIEKNSSSNLPGNFK